MSKLACRLLLFLSTSGVITAQLFSFIGLFDFPMIRFVYTLGTPFLVFLELFRRHKLSSIRISSLLFVFFELTLFLFLIVSFFLYSSVDQQRLYFYSQIIIIQLFYFLLFKNLNYDDLPYFILLFLISITAFVILYFVSDSKGLFLYLSNQDGDSERFVSYQGIGRVFLIFAGLLMPFVQVKQRLFFLIPFFAFIFFVNGGRSEFVLFLLGIFPLLLIKLKKAIGLMILVISLSGVFGFLSSDQIVLDEHRMLSLLDVNTAMVDGGRAELNGLGLKTALDNPITGSFSYWKSGEMSHNVWSIPSDFGFPVLILYLVMFLVLAFYAFRHFFSNPSVGRSREVFFVTIWLFGLFTAFWYGNELFGITLGVLSSGFIYSEKVVQLRITSL